MEFGAHKNKIKQKEAERVLISRQSNYSRRAYGDERVVRKVTRGAVCFKTTGSVLCPFCTDPLRGSPYEVARRRAESSADTR